MNPALEQLQNNPDLLIKLEDLELSTRAYNALEKYGVHFLGQLAFTTEAELLREPNFGKKSLIEVKEKLTKYGITLGMFYETGHPLLNSPKHFEELQKTLRSYHTAWYSETRREPPWKNDWVRPDEKIVRNILTNLFKIGLSEKKSIFQMAAEGGQLVIQLTSEQQERAKQLISDGADLSKDFVTAVGHIISTAQPSPAHDPIAALKLAPFE
ncbi:MAG: DNA-directed RNA polymerase subunit alpha C-terminal domain-containing protein [Alphaproteobacteria bacterium]